MYMTGRFHIELDEDGEVISIELDIPKSKHPSYFIIDDADILAQLNATESDAIAEFLREEEEEAKTESQVTDRLIDGD